MASSPISALVVVDASTSPGRQNLPGRESRAAAHSLDSPSRNCYGQDSRREAMADRYRNHLSISEDQRCVPYSSLAERGFRILKGRPERIPALPGAGGDPALRVLLEAMNGASTGIFSVACASQEAKAKGGYQLRGYIEFALNSRWAVQEEANYVPVFAGFDRWLRAHRFRSAESANVARVRPSWPELADRGRQGPLPETAEGIMGPAGLEPATNRV